MKLKLHPIKPVMQTISREHETVFDKLTGRIFLKRRVLIDFRRHVNKPQGKKS